MINFNKKISILAPIVIMFFAFAINGSIASNIQEIKPFPQKDTKCIYLYQGEALLYSDCGQENMGATITSIDASDLISNSRATMNTNFTNLNDDKLEKSDWYSTTTDQLTEGLTNLYNQTHTGEVTGATALTVANNVIDEANLKINSPTDLYLLVASSSASGGLEWMATSSTLLNLATGAGGGGSGTVTSVAMTVPTGLSITGSPITTSGTLALSFTGGYSIPLTASTTNWNTAYDWGDHSSGGYMTLSAFYSTTTDGISEGLNNLYYTDARVNSRIYTVMGATTSMPNLDITESQISDLQSYTLISDIYSVVGATTSLPNLNITESQISDIGTYLTSASAGLLYDVLGQATSTLASHTTAYNHANYDTAYGWGDHSTVGYYDSLADVTNAFSGCYGSDYLGADGICHHTAYRGTGANLRYRVIDTMKYQKDYVRNQFADDYAKRLIQFIANNLNVTHISIAIPLNSDADFTNAGVDAPSPNTIDHYTQVWVDAIHDEGLNVLWRGTLVEIEGLYDFTKADGADRIATGTVASAPTDATSTLLGKIYTYIDDNPGYFKDGDIWAPLPERTEGIFNDSTSFLASSTGYGVQSAYTDFFKDLKTVSDNAFSANNLRITTGYTANNYSEVASGWLQQGLFDDAGVVAFDHYGESPYAVSTMEANYNTVYTAKSLPLFHQEWSDYWNDDTATTTRMAYLEQMYSMMGEYANSGILQGFNYWGGWTTDVGSNECIFVNTTGSSTYPVFALKYNGKVLQDFLGTPVSYETIRATVGDMVASGTQSNISVAYNEATGYLDFTASAGGGGWDELSDMTLANGSIYYGNASNDPEATSTITIGANSYVGINQTSPAYTLDVSNNVVSNLNPTARFTSGSVDRMAGHFLSDDQGNYEAKVIWGDSNAPWDTAGLFIVGTIGDWPIVWHQADAEVMRMTEADNLGVGTSTPAYKLTVSGDLMLTGTIYDNNYSYGTNGQVLKSDGSGGLTWGADNTGSGGSGLWATTSATIIAPNSTYIVSIGTDDTATGTLYLYGDDNSKGGNIRFYNATDDDGTEEFWQMEPGVAALTSFDLGIDGAPSLFKFYTAGNFTATGNVAGATYASDGSVSDTELKYINTLSSNAQTQLDARLTLTAWYATTTDGLDEGTINLYQDSELTAWIDDVTLGASGALTIPTGQNFTIGAIQWNNGDYIEGDNIKDDTIDDDSLDFLDITGADFTLTDITNATSTNLSATSLWADTIYDNGAGTTTMQATNFDFGNGTNGLRIYPGSSTTLEFY